ncbi:LysR family transcriptional regulator [Roseobacteraceae bacterium NS-SX3]
MLDTDRISLNALRIFCRVAAQESISAAAASLGVTPSAVSHQIRRLEQALGTALLHRTGNALTLTPEGAALLQRAAPGLQQMEQAVAAVLRSGHEITLRCGVTFAVRWLVPALERFKQRHPEARIQLETAAAPGGGQSRADLEIAYVPVPGCPAPETVLLEDRCRPVAAPALIRRCGGDIRQLPALGAAAGDWDWAAWAQARGLPAGAVRIADRFDIDDTALRAAAAGLGTVLASPLMIRTELDTGALVPVPGHEPVLLGHYVLAEGPRRSALISRFRRWLRAELAAQAPDWPAADPE